MVLLILSFPYYVLPIFLQYPSYTQYKNDFSLYFLEYRRNTAFKNMTFRTRPLCPEGDPLGRPIPLPFRSFLRRRAYRGKPEIILAIAECWAINLYTKSFKITTKSSSSSLKSSGPENISHNSSRRFFR